MTIPLSIPVSFPVEDFSSVFRATNVSRPPALAGWFVFNALHAHTGTLFYLHVASQVGTLSAGFNSGASSICFIQRTGVTDTETLSEAVQSDRSICVIVIINKEISRFQTRIQVGLVAKIEFSYKDSCFLKENQLKRPALTLDGSWVAKISILKSCSSILPSSNTKRFYSVLGSGTTRLPFSCYKRKQLPLPALKK